MSDEEAIGAVIDEMYAMISGPAGPRDWSRQRNSFLSEARQVRTWVDEQQRPAMKMMGLDEYAENTTPFLSIAACAALIVKSVHVVSRSTSALLSQIVS